MANILDYIEWRGDLSFDRSPLCEIDAIIFSQLSYINYTGIIPTEFQKNGITLKEALNRFRNGPDFETRKHVGSMINPLTVKLLQLAGESERFGSLCVSGYVDKLDYNKEEQYSSITFSNGEWNFIAYRGTDDTILGWKENCNMAYEDVVPAQKDALLYLEDCAKSLKGKIITGGHSKGGNLALYASVNASPKTKKRLVAIYNNDGPGFSEGFFKRADFLEIKGREHTFVPELSIVGMLFNHAPGYTIVKSCERNMVDQHDPFGWQVKGCHFEELPERSEQSRFAAATVNELLAKVDREEKALFIETVFGLLNDTNAKTNTELSQDKMENMAKILKAASKLDAKTRDCVLKTMQVLIKIAWDNKEELKWRNK